LCKGKDIMLKSKIHRVLVLAVLLGVSLSLFGQTIPAPSAELETKLIGVLQSAASHQEKAAACRQLSVIGTTKSIGPLAALLGDEKLSHMARYALEPIQEAAVDEVFREQLGKLKGKPLVGVIGSVGVRGDTQAVSMLAKMLNDRDGEVSQAAARALGNIGNAAAAAALQGTLAKASGDRRLAVCEGLFRCAEGFVEQGRNDAAIVIYDSILNLKAPHQVRGGALRGAILARKAEGMGLLAKYLKDDDYILFSAAVQTAQESKVSQVTGVLLAALDGQSTDRKVLMIQALGYRGDRQALPTLYGLVQKGAKPVRLAAIGMLPQIPGSSGTVLMKVFDDIDREISSAAVDSFAAIDDPQCDVAVMKMLQSNDTNKRLMAIELIGRRWMTSALPALLQTAGGNESQVRVAAVKKVGEMGSSSEAEALLDLLGKFTQGRDLDAAERALSAICTKAGTPENCTRMIAGRLGQAQPAQKGALLRVLGAIGGAEALQAVRKAVDDPQADVHTAAIRVLSKWKTLDAARVLLDLAKQAKNTNDKTLCLRGYLSLASQQNQPASRRLAMCREAADLIQRNDEKKMMLGALGKIVSPEALPMITPYLNDQYTRTEAGTAIVTISEKLLKDRNAARHAAKLIGPLEKVIEANPEGGLAQRAKGFLKQAKQKAKQ
jgi:HEAT repeat protein